jgi:hypothetical protein
VQELLEEKDAQRLDADDHGVFQAEERHLLGQRQPWEKELPLEE